VRPHRYALATAGEVVIAGVLGLHECDNPVFVKIAAEGDVQHVVSGSQGDNTERMARMRRGGGRLRCGASTVGQYGANARWRCARRCGMARTLW
jgi:hypothetical protein